MPPWIAFTLGCASTILLFITYCTLDTSTQVSQPSMPAPGSQFGGGFGYPIYNKGVIQVLNETLEIRSLPFAVEAPQFGTELPPVSGELRIVTDDGEQGVGQACEAVAMSLAGSIALVASGGCSPVIKLLNCQAAGAAGVVLENDLLRGMHFVPEAIHIPGLSAIPTTFKFLVSKAGETASLWTLPHGLNFNTTDVLILLVVRPLMLFFIVSILLAVNLGYPDTRRTAPPTVVSALPTRIWSRPDGSAFAVGIWNQDGCRICLEDFVDGCEVMTLPCGHEFHASCVSAWLLKQHEVCPLCKRGVDRERIPLLV